MGVLEQVWSSTGLINVTLTNFDQATHINKALGLDKGSGTPNTRKVGKISRAQLEEIAAALF